jgi:hypothetical protein
MKKSKRSHPWKPSDPRWKMVVEGRWPPSHPRAKRPGDGRGQFQARPYHLRDRRRSRRYQKHGLITLQNAVRQLGDRAIDPRTPVGRALAAWRSDLIADLGGPESVSTQQIAVVDLAVRTKLILDSVDAWLLAQPTLVHHKTRTLLPVVLQRQTIANALAHYMTQLGLERRRAKAVTLTEYLATARRDSPKTAASPDPAPESSSSTTDAEGADPT